MKQCTSQCSDFTYKSDCAAVVDTLTFKHLDCDGHSFLGFVLIDAQGLCHYNLAEAAFTQGLAQGQPATTWQQHKEGKKKKQTGSWLAAETLNYNKNASTWSDCGIDSLAVQK